MENLRRAITAEQWIGRRFEWPGSISGGYWSRFTAKRRWSWRNGVGPRCGDRTGSTAAESALRALRFTTRVVSAFGGVEGHAASSGGLGGAGWRRRRRVSCKAAAGVGHGAAHLLLLVADARKAPGVRVVQEQEGGDEEQGDAVALARSTSASEENDSSHLTESLKL